MAGESRFTKTDPALNEVNELTLGYKMPVDNPGATTMEVLDPRNLLSERIKRVEIGAWSLYNTQLKTVNLSAYEGRVSGFLGPVIIDDDGYTYDGKALWDSYIFNDTNKSGALVGNMENAFGSAITQIAHGYIDVTGTPSLSPVFSASVAGQTVAIAKVGQKFTVTFNTPTGITPNNAIVVINPTASGNDELEEHNVITNGFVVDFASAVPFYYTVYSSNANLPANNESGTHLHSMANVSVNSNTNLQSFQVISRINPEKNQIEMTHNFYEQVTSGTTTFGSITRAYNALALPKFRNQYANRGYIWLLLDYPTNPF